MHKSSIKKNFPIDSISLECNDQIDQSCFDGPVSKERLVPKFQLPLSVILARKIEIISRFLDNGFPNYEDNANPMVPEVINDFKKLYPNRDDHQDGLKKLYDDYYSIR